MASIWSGSDHDRAGIDVTVPRGPCLPGDGIDQLIGGHEAAVTASTAGNPAAGPATPAGAAAERSWDVAKDPHAEPHLGAATAADEKDLDVGVVGTVVDSLGHISRSFELEKYVDVIVL